MFESSWFSVFGSAAIKSVVVLAAAWLVAALIRKRSAAARHMVWSSAVAVLLAVPLFTAALPQWQLPVSRTLLPLDPSVIFQADAITVSSLSSTARAPIAGNSRAPRPSRSRGIGFWLLFLWVAGFVFSMAQSLLAMIALWRIRRVSSSLPEPEVADELARSLGIHRRVPVLLTARSTMPLTAGIVGATIYLPADAELWSPERLRAVLLHELAHVRRGDVIVHALAHAVLSFYWWNPLAWVAWRKLLEERERAADDIVLRAGERASDYAGHLLEIARSLQCPLGTASLTVAMARRSQLEGRLVAILDSATRRGAPRRGVSAIAAGAALALAVPIAVIHAQQAPAPAGDVEATIRAAQAQKDYAMLDRAAEALQHHREFTAAASVYEAALQIRGQVAGEQSQTYAEGLLHLGDLARAHGVTADAASYYTRALALDNGPETAGANEFLGLEAHAKKNDPSATDHFQRVLSLDPNGPYAGPAWTWMAVLSKDPVEAEQLFKRALAQEDPHSPEEATTLELYARFLHDQLREPEAKPLVDEAAGIRRAHFLDLSRKSNSTEPALKVGNGTSAPRLLSKVEPAYTLEGKAARIQGPVALSVVIGVDGRAFDATLLRSLGFGLDEAALNAVSQWRFQPGAKDGQPVPIAAVIQVNFRLL
ncbi:MAG TPA: TonB family protein [Bryobacteraceae bacterium]|nr:TonB family protein [Bryobacteraceae bacterium]